MGENIGHSWNIPTIIEKITVHFATNEFLTK